jgi:hypothetical protein
MVCPRTFSKPCPQCEEVRRLSNEDYDKNEKEIKAIRAKEQDLYALILPKVDPDQIVLFDWSFSKFTKWLKEKINKSNPDVLGFASATGGMVIKLNVVEKEFQGKKFVTADRASDIEFLPGKSVADLSDEILDAVPLLDDLLACPTYDEMEAAFHGAVEEDDDAKDDKDNGDADGHTARVDNSSGVRRRNTQVTDDGDSDGKPVNRSRRRDDGDEGEAAPVRGRNAGARSTADDNEWGDDPAPRDGKGGERGSARKDSSRRDADEDTPPAAERGGGRASSKKVTQDAASDWD